MVRLSLYLYLLAPLATLSVAATPRTSPPAGCITVSGGGGQQFRTIQSAVDSLSTSSTSAQCIFIYPGTYWEQVYVPPRSARLTIYGSTTDTSGYAQNGVTITSGRSRDDAAGNDETGTLRAWAAGLKVYNVNIVNSRGRGIQAIALSAQADQQGYYGVKLVGYQDTLLANTGRQVYASSYIDGATDFIFGAQSRAWFEKVDLRIKGPGWVTANGRDSNENPSYYLFNKCNIAVAAGSSVANGKSSLGRPWRNYSRVVFQNTEMSAVINPAGWSSWSDISPNTDNVFYREYRNTGPGSQGTRASFAGWLSAAVSVSEVLGSTDWVDWSYL